MYETPSDRLDVRPTFACRDVQGGSPWDGWSRTETAQVAWRGPSLGSSKETHGHRKSSLAPLDQQSDAKFQVSIQLHLRAFNASPPPIFGTHVDD